MDSSEARVPHGVPMGEPSYCLKYTLKEAEVSFPRSGCQIVIGRAPGNHLVPDETDISRHHARLTLEGDTWVVADPTSRAEQTPGAADTADGAGAEAIVEEVTALASCAAIAIEQARLGRRIEEEKKAKEKLERYHSPAVIRRRLSTSESSSGGVALILNDFFSRMTDVIFAHEGTLDK